MVVNPWFSKPLLPQGLKKPYNPIIGETFRCMWLHERTNSKTFYIGEQVTVTRLLRGV